MNYSKWKTIMPIEQSFENAIFKLNSLFQSLANSSNGNTQEYQRKMDEFQNTEEFDKYINSAVKRMVTPITVLNMRTWRLAAKKATRGNKLYNMLMAEINAGIKSDIENQVHENSLLIKTLPHDVAAKVCSEIEKSAFEGKRATTIAQEIRTYTDNYTKASAKLIARTEVSKATTALTKARCDNLDLKWYVWRTSLDGDRVRESHRIMEGVLIRWDNPPSPELLNDEQSVGNYHAGNIWNCRCYPEPLLDVNDVKWPHKVHLNGQIRSMTKTEFIKLNGGKS